MNLFVVICVFLQIENPGVALDNNYNENQICRAKISRNDNVQCASQTKYWLNGKRLDFSFRLKESIDGKVRVSSGREFQSLEEADLNAVSPNRIQLQVGINWVTDWSEAMRDIKMAKRFKNVERPSVVRSRARVGHISKQTLCILLGHVFFMDVTFIYCTFDWHSYWICRDRKNEVVLMKQNWKIKINWRPFPSPLSSSTPLPPPVNTQYILLYWTSQQKTLYPKHWIPN